MFYRSYLAIIVVSLSLFACTRVDVAPQQSDFRVQSFAQRQPALQHLTHWQINGAFSVREHDDSHIVNYEWQQQGPQYQIDIHSSLGLYRVKLVGDAHHAALYETDQPSLQAESVAALLQQRLGWSLPVTDLVYWIRGLPAPGGHQARFDGYGHLLVLQQQGWTVDLSRYVTVKSLDLPRILDIRGYGLQLRIAVKQWRF